MTKLAGARIPAGLGQALQGESWALSSKGGPLLFQPGKHLHPTQGEPAVPEGGAWDAGNPSLHEALLKLELGGPHDPPEISPRIVFGYLTKEGHSFCGFCPAFG